MQGELNKNVVEGEKGERGSPPDLFFFPLLSLQAQMFYGLYKLLRARECPPIWRSGAEAQTYHFPFPPFSSLSQLPRCKSIPTHKQQRQLGNRAATILQHHSIMAAQNYFHGGKKRSRFRYFSLMLSVCEFSVSDPRITVPFTHHMGSPPHFIVLFLTTPVELICLSFRFFFFFLFLGFPVVGPR